MYCLSSVRKEVSKLSLSLDFTFHITLYFSIKLGLFLVYGYILDQENLKILHIHPQFSFCYCKNSKNQEKHKTTQYQLKFLKTANKFVNFVLYLCIIHKKIFCSKEILNYYKILELWSEEAEFSEFLSIKQDINLDRIRFDLNWLHCRLQHALGLSVK